MEGILIGTAILWALTAVLVVPLTSLCLGRKMAAAGVVAASLETLPDEEKARWRRVATNYYVLWDVIVLGTAGLIGGLLGYYFIGVSLEAKGWPGMVAFIAASFLGLAARTT